MFATINLEETSELDLKKETKVREISEVNSTKFHHSTSDKNFLKHNANSTLSKKLSCLKNVSESNLTTSVESANTSFTFRKIFTPQKNSDTTGKIKYRFHRPALYQSDYKILQENSNLYSNEIKPNLDRFNSSLHNSNYNSVQNYSLNKFKPVGNIKVCNVAEIKPQLKEKKIHFSDKDEVFAMP